MRSNSSATVTQITLSLREVFPDVDPDRSDDVGVYRTLVEHVIPNFDSEVLFVFLEVLGLQRIEGKAETLVYSTLEPDDAEQLAEEYFNLINHLFDSRGWSLSAVDNLYFDPTIWCAEITGDQSFNAGDRKPNWHESKQKKNLSDRTYQVRGRQSPDDVELLFGEYIEKLRDFYKHAEFEYLGHFPYSYVLLIPVALNSSDRSAQRKVAAIFLHFSCRQRLESIQLLNIYQRTILFWHHHYTAEALERQRHEAAEVLEQQRQEAESDRHQARVFRGVQDAVQDFRGHLESLYQVVRNLEDSINPVRGLIFGGRNCETLFHPGITPVGKQRCPVEGCHDRSVMTMDADRWPLEKKMNLVAAIVMVALGKSDSFSSPGWKSLVDCVSVGQAKCQPLMVALVKHIPAIGSLTPEVADVENAFSKLKLWFNTAYKQQSTVGLPYGLLEMAFESWSVDLNVLGDMRYECFRVGSRSPIETLDALASLESGYGFSDAQLEISSDGLQNTLTLQLRRELNSQCDFVELKSHIHEAQGSSPRGDMTRILFLLLGKGTPTADKAGKTYELITAEGRASVSFIMENKFKITWKGPPLPC